MAIGVIDPDNKESGFVSFKQLTYTLLSNKLTLKATNKQCVDEVIRRVHLANFIAMHKQISKTQKQHKLKQPQCWNIVNCMSKLEQLVATVGKQNDLIFK